MLFLLCHAICRVDRVGMLVEPTFRISGILGEASDDVITQEWAAHPHLDVGCNPHDMIATASEACIIYWLCSRSMTTLVHIDSFGVAALQVSR